jgi:toxin ParE1/3/4
MAHEIYKRPQAARDIEECFVYIAEENLNAGVYFLVAVEDSLEQIAEFPGIGRKRDFHDQRFQNIRMWHVKKYEKFLIFYEVLESRIEIVRVLHASRDIEDLFG